CARGAATARQSLALSRRSARSVDISSLAASARRSARRARSPRRCSCFSSSMPRASRSPGFAMGAPSPSTARGTRTLDASPLGEVLDLLSACALDPPGQILYACAQRNELLGRDTIALLVPRLDVRPAQEVEQVLVLLGPAREGLGERRVQRRDELAERIEIVCGGLGARENEQRSRKVAFGGLVKQERGDAVAVARAHELVRYK